MISKPSKLENRSLLLYNYSPLKWAERTSHVWVVFGNQSSKYSLADPFSFPLCFSEDFNHREEIECRGVARKRQIHRREAAAWSHLTLQYGLMDAWKLDNF
jgi:hypothetical protein